MSSDPNVIPMLTYEDGLAALDWLARAFGFRELTRMCDPATGRLMYGELEVAVLHGTLTRIIRGRPVEKAKSRSSKG